MREIISVDDDEVETLPHRPLKGRGSITNSTPRFEPHVRAKSDDGWGNDPIDDPDLPPLKTTVTPDHTKTVITKNNSPDIPFDQSLNAFRGCEHGCVYCFARPTHAYLGLSPGLDFETKLVAKFDAAELLEKELRAPKYRCSPLALGTNTDPYQPIERKYQITRKILQVLSKFNHPVTIVTKSFLVTRDIDILQSMASRNLVRVALSVTTLDSKLARSLEPRASTPALRLKAMRLLSDAGIATNVMVAPVIPGLTDHEIERILEAAAGSGAIGAGTVLLRLPLEIKDLFAEWLDVHEPGRARHIMNLVRQARDGKLNDSSFGSRMRGSGAYADMIQSRFKLARKRLYLDKPHPALDCQLFKIPLATHSQLAFALDT
jgi:DNA repair photolyase